MFWVCGVAFMRPGRFIVPRDGGPGVSPTADCDGLPPPLPRTGDVAIDDPISEVASPLSSGGLWAPETIGDLEFMAFCRAFLRCALSAWFIKCWVVSLSP